MAFRTIVVSSQSKLELNLGYLVFRTVDETKRILINEIHTLIIQSTAVSITAALLCELTKKKVKTIFCDEKNNPYFEISPFYNNTYTPRLIHEQIAWDKDFKMILWQFIIKNKIQKQAQVLKRHGLDEKSYQLINYAENVELDDSTNREGHAAKVYFNSLYYDGFTRQDDSFINGALNYGYSILLAQINREVVNAGFLTQLGIHHRNIANQFNLSCDLMEVFRPIVDDAAKRLKEGDDFKKIMQKLFDIAITIDDKTQTFYNAIKLFVNAVFSAIDEHDLSLINIYTNYEL